MKIDDLIQLMRLSSTSKVRAYLHDLSKSAAKGPGPERAFLTELEYMFQRCKRTSAKEAWPTMIENET